MAPTASSACAGRVCLFGIAVGDEDEAGAAAHAVGCLATEAPQGSFQTFARAVAEIDLYGAFDILRQRQNLAQFALRADRRIQQDLFGILCRQLEDVSFRADLRHQRHHQQLAQRIDRRIGDLRKAFAEAIEQRPHLARHRRHRRVVAHRAGRLGFGFGEHLEHGFALLAAEPVELLPAMQLVCRQRFGGEAGIDQIGFEIGDAVAQPLAKRRACAIDRVDVRIEQQFARAKIHRQHLTRPEPALGHHL